MSNQHTRLILATLVAALAATFALAPAAHADRRSSLSGNLLIKDTDDMFFFPHIALEHVRLVTFDLAVSGNSPSDGALGNLGGATSQVGNAGLLFGTESTAIGLFTHRSDTWGVLVPSYYGGGDVGFINGDPLLANAGVDLWPTLPFAPGGAVPGPPHLTPLQWIDLLAAFQLGASPLGFRVSLGHDRDNSTTDADGDIIIEDNTVWGFNAIVGYGIRGGLNLDLAGELSIGSQSWLSDNDGDPVQTHDATGINVSLMARGFSNMARGVDLGFTGLLFYRSYSSAWDNDDDASGVDASAFGIDFGAGPLYHIDEKFNIAAYGTLGFRNAFRDPNFDVDFDERDDDFTSNALLIPSLKIAGEYRVFDWLWLRTGAQYFFAFDFVSRDPAPDTFTDTSEALSGFRWSSGVGVVWEGLELNGTFNTPFLLSGPNFIGGGSDMFAHLNVMYRF